MVTGLLEYYTLCKSYRDNITLLLSPESLTSTGGLLQAVRTQHGLSASGQPPGHCMISSGHRYHFRIGCSLGNVGRDDVLIAVPRCEVMEQTLKLTFVLHIEDFTIMKNDIS
jgi:hypothetical protein